MTKLDQWIFRLSGAFLIGSLRSKLGLYWWDMIAVAFMFNSALELKWEEREVK